MTADDKRPAPGAPSVLGSWPRTLLRALAARGIDGRTIAADAGLDVQRLDDGEARWPAAAAARFWRRAAAATADPAIGLFASRFATYTTFHALAGAVLASATLREAFGRVVRYGRVIGDAAVMRLDARRDGVRLSMTVPAGAARPADEAIDATLALVLRVARLLRERRELAPLRVELERAAPSPSEPFARFFRAPIAFAARRNALDFAAADVDAPLPGGNAELARRVDEVLARSVTRLDERRIAGRARACMVERLPDGEPSQAAVARALGLGARTLQRRLAQEGTTFQALLEATRAELARAYLAEGWSVTETAFALGFSDASSFSRAFRRWTGAPPSQRLRRS